MSDASRYVEVVQTLYDRCAVADWPAAAAHLTEDFFVTESPELPFAGTYHGREALQRLYQIVFGMLDVASLDIRDIAVGKDHAVVILDMVLAGPEPTKVALAEVFRFRGDKVCEIRPHYFDTAPIIAAVRHKLSA